MSHTAMSHTPETYTPKHRARFPVDGQPDSRHTRGLCPRCEPATYAERAARHRATREEVGARLAAQHRALIAQHRDDTGTPFPVAPMSLLALGLLGALDDDGQML